ncbi:tetratricopeptide repeat protein (plasmid) [Streptomyces sp. CA-294286]|uniref:tetratricopeptide repeat protein n=1 Tax=Streptomyces sp. CA-294286 TaxID=3240070 RepID=UPI003D8A2FF3
MAELLAEQERVPADEAARIPSTANRTAEQAISEAREEAETSAADARARDTEALREAMRALEDGPSEEEGGRRDGPFAGLSRVHARTAQTYTELLATQEQELGPDHSNTFATREKIAYRLGEAGEASGAVRAYTELLTAQEQELGPDHPYTFATREGIAYWLGEAGKFSGASVAYQELRAAQLWVLGPNHPDTLASGERSLYWLDRLTPGAQEQ